MDPAEDDVAAAALRRAAAVVDAADADFEAGRLDGSEARVREAIAALPPAQRDAPAGARVVGAGLAFALARLLGRRRAFEEALAALRQALDLVDDGVAPLLAARAEGLQGGVLAVTGDLAPALDRFTAARARFEAIGGAGVQRDCARLSMNIAIALTEFGRVGEAALEMDRALALFESLVQAGAAGALPERARALRNHAFVLGRAGRNAASTAALRASVADFDRALARPAADTDAALWRASRAGTLNSLGFSLFTLGDLDAAEAVQRRAARGFAALVRVQPAQRDEQARLWVNRAHVAAARGHTAAAARLYRRGGRTFEALVAAGARHHAPDVVNAALGSARLDLLHGRAGASAQRFEGALATLAELTQQGHLQHAAPWASGWSQQWQAWQAAVARHGTALAPAARALQRVLDRPPVRGASAGAEPLRALADAAGWVAAVPAGWPARAAAAYERVAQRLVAHLLDALAALLVDADPAWLRRHAGAVADSVRRLHDAAALRRPCAPLLADWFFSTRGLRAQRAALAFGSDPRLAELQSVLQELQAIEAEMLGEVAPAPAAEPGPGRRATVFAAGGVPSPYAEQRAARWRALRAVLPPLRAQLRGAGLLADEARLDSRRARAALAADEALLLLARLDAHRLRLLVLTRAGGVEHQVTRLAAEVAAFPCTTLNRLARSAMTRAASGQPLRATSTLAAADELPADADAFALEVYAALWQDTLAPVLARLAARRITRVALVPSDDLHLVPWNHLADAPAATRRPALRVLPSSGAWWRAAARPAPVPTPPRWALAVGGADGEAPLPWLAVEAELARRLWGGALQPLAFDADGRPSAAGVDALLAMGHGGADANPAHAGLALGHGVLRPADLPRLPDCRRLLVSACLLGRTEEAEGEPLGFVAACFEHRASFVAGWLTEVPDFAACLFSTAAQWALRGAAGADWSAVFTDLRLQLREGRWPPGFGAWLTTQASALQAPALEDAAAAPPALLRRALPWAVVLGD